MIIRKIHRSGSYSGIIALPADWLKLNDLKIKDKVIISTNERGDLVIYAKKKNE